MLRCLVFSGFLLGVTFCADPVARAQTEGLLLYLPLDECSGETTGGTVGPEAMVVNSPEWVDGKTGCALEFDGTSNWVEVPVDPQDDPFSTQAPGNQGEITICAWVSVLAVATDTHGQTRQPIVMKGNSGEWEYALYVYDDFGAGMSIWNCGGSGVSEPHAPGTLPQDEWHHVCGTFNVTDGVTVYVDALQVTQLPPNGNVPCDGTRSVFLAHREDGQFLRAIVDEVAIWERVLDEDEILAVMEGALSTEPKVPVLIKRDIPDTLINGTSGVVTLTANPKFGSGVVVINEKLPAGLTPSNPSHNGVVAGDTVTWNLGKVDTEIVVSYTMTAALDAANAKFLSTATVDGVVTNIGGDTSYKGAPFTSNGFIKLWNHLGPLAWQQPARANDHGPPGACDANSGLELPVDWIVNEDGTVHEKNIYPFPGLITRPKYGGDGVVPGGTGARAAGLTVAAGDTGLVVRDRFPVWKGSLTRADTIDHASNEVHGFDAEDHLTMSCVYVTNNTGAPIDTSIGLGSDDAIQIFLGDLDVSTQDPILASVCRPWGAPNEEQNILPVTLPRGESRLLVKVTDGCCGSGFRLRFQDPVDPTGPGLMTPQITLSLESKEKPRPGDVARSLSKGSIGLGETVDVTLNVSMKTASNVLVREVLPNHAQASVISDGGALTGNTIEWNLAQVTQKTLSYKLAVGPCAGDLAYGQSTFKMGSTEVVVSGTSTISRTYRQDDLGAAWKSGDIGTAGGSPERLGDHEVLVNASGAGVKLLKDEFHFISLAQTSDFEVSARIGCFDDPGGRGMAGLMVRDSREEGAANAFFGLSSTLPAGGGVGTLKVSFRQDLNKTTSQVTTIAAADKDVAQLPIYLKLVRTGATLSFQRSADGTSYKEILAKNGPGDTRPVILKPDVLVGLGVTGGGGGSTRGDFQAVSGPPFVTEVVGQFRRGDTDGSGTLDLTDAIAVLGRLFLGAAEPACLDAADADDSGVLDLTDAIYSLGWQFTGGAIPPAPGPTACGSDPTEDGLKACVYPGC